MNEIEPMINKIGQEIYGTDNNSAFCAGGRLADNICQKLIAI